MRKHEFGRPYKRRDGKLGARVSVRCESRGWHGQIDFDSHGLTSAEVAARIDAFAAKHEAKASRLTDFRAVLGTEIVAHGVVYRIVDCTIRGDRDDLYVDVRRLDQQGEEIVARVAGFPLQRRYPAIADIPNMQAIVQMVRQALPDDEREVEKLHEEFTRKVAAKLP